MVDSVKLDTTGTIVYYDKNPATKINTTGAIVSYDKTPYITINTTGTIVSYDKTAKIFINNCGLLVGYIPKNDIAVDNIFAQIETTSTINTNNIFCQVETKTMVQVVKWVLKPRTIFKHPDVDELVDTVIPYHEVYREVPTLLVSEKELEVIYQAGKAPFPLKSNLLLLDYTLLTKMGSLYEFIICVFLKEYNDEVISLYFYDSAYDSTLWNIYYLWYVLVTKYYNTTWLKDLHSFNDSNLFIRFVYDPYSNPFYIEGVGILQDGTKDPYKLDNVMDRYDKINSRETLDSFCKEIFEDNFLKYYRNPNNYTASDMENIFRSSEGELYDYVENRINTSLDPKNEIGLILHEIYDSLAVYFYNSGNENMKKYAEYFLSALPQIAVKPEKTKSYLILYNFKPFHTEIITRSKSGIYSNDKFNAAYTDSNFAYAIMEMLQASVLDIGKESFRFDSVMNYQNDSVDFMTRLSYITEYIKQLNMVVSDRYNLDMEQSEVSIQMISEHINKLIEYNSIRDNNLLTLNLRDEFVIS